MADEHNRKNRVSKTMIVILTDGEENSSRNITREKLFDLIKNRESQMGWEFVYLSANKDAIKAGTSLGMKSVNCIDWSRNNAKNKICIRNIT